MSATLATATHTKTIAWSRVLVAGSITAAGAVGANVVVYLGASAAGAMPQDVFVRPNQPITLGAAAGTTFMGVIGATGVFGLLNRFTRRPITIFRVVALAVLALSFATPFTIPDAPAVMIVALEIMHIVAAAIAVYALTVLTRTHLPL